jgi:hypothetical protein
MLGRDTSVKNIVSDGINLRSDVFLNKESLDSKFLKFPEVEAIIHLSCLDLAHYFEVHFI